MASQFKIKMNTHKSNKWKLIVAGFLSVAICKPVAGESSLRIASLPSGQPAGHAEGFDLGSALATVKKPPQQSQMRTGASVSSPAAAGDLVSRTLAALTPDALSSTEPVTSEGSSDLSTDFSAPQAPVGIELPDSTPPAQRDLFSRLFTAASDVPGPITEQNQTPAAAADNLQIVVTADAGPVAFAPVGEAPVGEITISTCQEQPDLYKRLYTVASDSVLASESHTTSLQELYPSASPFAAVLPVESSLVNEVDAASEPEHPDLFTSLVPVVAESKPTRNSRDEDAPSAVTGASSPLLSEVASSEQSPKPATATSMPMQAPQPVSQVAATPANAPPTSIAEQVNIPNSQPGAQTGLLPADSYPSVAKFADQQHQITTETSSTPIPAPIETFVLADGKQPTTSQLAEDSITQGGHLVMMEGTDATLPGQPTEAGLSPQIEATELSGPMPFDMGQSPCSCPYLPGQSGTRSICGVDCGRNGAPCCSNWSDARCIPWSLFGPGEYVGPARTEHVSTYYLRVNDAITLTFITSRRKEAERYRIGCGDRLSLEWLRSPTDTDRSLDREVLVQPDGTIAVPLIGEVTVAGKTVKDVRDELIKAYGQFQRDPQITVTPLDVNMGIQDVIQGVTSVSGSNGQTQLLRVTPEGTIQAPGLGSVFVQGLTLDELRNELEARYATTFGPGLIVSPSLTERATSYVFVGGEVVKPSRYTLEGPTTVMQAVAMAGGWNIGGNLHQVVIFRRDENWCMKATKIDIRAPLYGNDPCPANDVWLRDNDLVIVPKSKILCATDVINLYFTRGIYAVVPINYVYDFSQSSGIVPVP